MQCSHSVRSGLASALLDAVLATHTQRIDRRRLLITGASMGGYGAWELLQRRPGLFEAAVIICGGGDPSLAHLLRSTRIWAFHSQDVSIAWGAYMPSAAH